MSILKGNANKKRMTITKNGKFYATHNFFFFFDRYYATHIIPNLTESQLLRFKFNLSDWINKGKICKILETLNASFSLNANTDVVPHGSHWMTIKTHGNSTMQACTGKKNWSIPLHSRSLDHHQDNLPSKPLCPTTGFLFYSWDHLQELPKQAYASQSNILPLNHLHILMHTENRQSLSYFLHAICISKLK